MPLQPVRTPYSISAEESIEKTLEGPEKFLTSIAQMPLYNLLCITKHFPQYGPIQNLIQTSTSLIHQNGGVVRNVDYWGRRNLPQRMRRHQMWEEEGDYWTMTFDTNPPSLKELNDRLKMDPRVIRWSTSRLATTLPEIVRGNPERTVRYPVTRTDDRLGGLSRRRI